MTTKKSTRQELTTEEIEELRAYVDAGIRSVSNTNLEEMERISGPLKQSEILFLAAIGASKKGQPRRNRLSVCIEGDYIKGIIVLDEYWTAVRVPTVNPHPIAPD